MAANDEPMSDTPEYGATDDGRAGVSEQTFASGQESADTQPLEGGQGFADTQPFENWHTFDDTQSLATISSDQPAIVDSDAEALAALKKLEEQRKVDRRKRRIAIIVACVVALALIGGWAVAQMAGLFSKSESAPSTAVVKRTNLTTSVQATGIVVPGAYVNVSAEVPGIIQDVLVSDGQEVKAGSVLFTLRNNDIDKELDEAQIAINRANRDLAEAQAGVSDAQADYSKAKKEYDDMVAEEKAEERKAVAHAEKAYQDTYDELVALIPEYATKQERKQMTAEAKKSAQEAYDLTYLMESPGEISEFDDSFYSAAIDSANSVVVGAEEYVSDLQRSYESVLEEAEKRTVRAPVSGTVFDLLAVEGASVGFASGGTSTAKSDTLAKIADSSKISVDVQISEVDISAIEVGQRAVLTFAALPDLELVGKVDSVASVASNVSDDISSMNLSDAVTFKVTVVANVTDKRLKPGMSASVKIMTKDVPNMLVVPAGAVQEENGTAYVTVAKNEEATETEKRTVVVADRTSLEVAIASGLKEGEIVIDHSADSNSSSESSSSASSSSTSTR